MILIFSGPSTIGKDTIWIPAAKHYGFKQIIMHTTRKQRPNEGNGVDYYFISKKEFRKMILNDEFIEWDYYFSNYYGFRKDLIENIKSNNLVAHSIARLAHRIRSKNNKVIIVSLLPKSKKELYQRLQKRNYNTAELLFRKYHINEEIDNSFLCDYKFKNADSVSFTEACKIISIIMCNCKR